MDTNTNKENGVQELRFTTGKSRGRNAIKKINESLSLGVIGEVKSIEGQVISDNGNCHELVYESGELSLGDRKTSDTGEIIVKGEALKSDVLRNILDPLFEDVSE